MIQTLLNDHTLMGTVLGVCVFAGLIGLLVARAAQQPLIMSLLTATSTALILSATLYPLSLNAPANNVCYIERDLLTGAATTQGLMNITLFIPAAAAWTWITRRPVSVALALAGLSAGIETIQAITPGMGRACDSTDWITNIIGALIGTAAVALILWYRHRNAHLIRPGRHFVRVFSAAMVAIAALCATMVTPVMSDVAWAHDASGPQRKAALKAAKEFLPPTAHVVRVQFDPGPGGTGTIQLSTDKGSLLIDWPSQEVQSGMIDPVPERGATKQDHVSDEEAAKVAKRFIDDHFPWALPAKQSISRVGPHDEARLVSLRRYKDDVMMPMRMDVVIRPGGRVASFAARHVKDPALPKVRISRSQAVDAASVALDGHPVASSVLLAARDEQGRWRPYWMITPKDVVQDGAVMDGVPDDSATQAKGCPVNDL
ncbi:VanZ family protein, partial [Streptomyces sp. F-3]|uniref:VanZ family protein n=1 Tax=Streptomyces sp. F-3 TaxID=1840095 RepID=UPI000835E101